MHRIMITGSNGLLGQKLVHLLRDKSGVTLLATARGDERMSHKSGYNYRSLDITDRSAILDCFEDFKPTAVINTAAMTNVDACESEIEACHAINVEAVSYLLEASQLHDTHLIHLSTDFVFDGEAGPYRESDIPNPLSEYARSKYKAEQLLLNSGYANWAVARTIIIYGVGENMSRSNVVLWAKDSLQSGKTIDIVDDQVRSPTLAEDLALGCWGIAEHKATGLYHLSGPEVMSIYEMVLQIADYYGLDSSLVRPVQTDALGRPAARPPRTGFIIDKARADFRYTPRSLKEGLALLDKQLATKS